MTLTPGIISDLPASLLIYKPCLSLWFLHKATFRTVGLGINTRWLLNVFFLDLNVVFVRIGIIKQMMPAIIIDKGITILIPWQHKSCSFHNKCNHSWRSNWSYKCQLFQAIPLGLYSDPNCQNMVELNLKLMESLVLITPKIHVCLLITFTYTPI